MRWPDVAASRRFPRFYFAVQGLSDLGKNRHSDLSRRDRADIETDRGMNSANFSFSKTGTVQPLNPTSMGFSAAKRTYIKSIRFQCDLEPRIV